MQDDDVIYRRELRHRLRVSGETIRKWLRDGKLPAPDVRLSLRATGWRVGTLKAAGVNVF